MTTSSTSHVSAPTTRSSRASLWLAVGCGLVAAAANLLLVSAYRGSQVTMLKAKQTLQAGRTVAIGDFDRITVQSDQLEDMKALAVDDKTLSAFKDIPLGETVLRGQVLTQASFSFDGTRDIRDLIGPDERGLTLLVDREDLAGAYLVKPGARVDAWMQDGSPNIPLLEDALVRAVDGLTLVPGDAGSNGFRYRTVTVVVPRGRLPDIMTRLAGSRGGVRLTQRGR